jgi:hypothetical protein
MNQLDPVLPRARRVGYALVPSQATGQRLNIFPDELVWTDALLEERSGLELAAAPIVTDPGAS